MDKKQLSVLIILGVLVFLIGGILGIFYQSQISSQGVKVSTVNSLSSKTVTSITAYGKVAKIEGRDITLNNLGDNLVVSVADSARVYSLSSASGTPAQKTVTFAEIKVGDNVNVVLKVLPSGQIQGSSVIIFSANSQ